MTSINVVDSVQVEVVEPNNATVTVTVTEQVAGTGGSGGFGGRCDGCRGVGRRRMSVPWI